MLLIFRAFVQTGIEIHNVDIDRYNWYFSPSFLVRRLLRMEILIMFNVLGRILLSHHGQ